MGEGDEAEERLDFILDDAEVLLEVLEEEEDEEVDKEADVDARVDRDEEDLVGDDE